MDGSKFSPDRLNFAYIQPADRPAINRPPRAIRLARQDRLGVRDLKTPHPQEAQALLKQVRKTISDYVNGVYLNFTSHSDETQRYM